MIRFKNVTKDFGGEIPALVDVSFEIGDGEFVFLTGHSGSGKSTLLKIITKEYVPSAGDVDFNDVPLSKIKGRKIHQHRRKIGVVFQDYRLLPELNIWENIALPLEIAGKKNAEIEERVTDLLELVNLTDKAHVFPSQLSGGESQRVGVARALATAPAVLLADEPTGNLDPQNTLLIAKLFHKINELGTTIIFATHDQIILETLKHRQLHLNKGKLEHDTGSKKTATDTTIKVADEPAKATPATSAATPEIEVEVEVENLDETPVTDSELEHKLADMPVEVEIEPTDETLSVTTKTKKPRFGGFKLGKLFGRKKAAPEKPVETTVEELDDEEDGDRDVDAELTDDELVEELAADKAAKPDKSAKVHADAKPKSKSKPDSKSPKAAL